MFIVRYNKNDEIIDHKVTLESAHKVFERCRRKYLCAEIIYVDENNNEHIIWG